MKTAVILCSVLLMIVAGCKQESPSPDPKPTEPSAADAKSYAARGIVKAIATDGRSATIKHEEIPGYMKAMTMELSVRNTNEFAGIAPNDEITFMLCVTDTDDWIEDVRFVAHHIGETTNGVIRFQAPNLTLNIGDTLGDYEFTGEDGKTFHLSDFRGKAVVFTFFFTSCPLPEFCPRMNKNLAEARTLLGAQTNAPANWQMLSVSFDPDLDRPEVIASYGKFYRGGDTNRWLFAVASTNTLAGLSPKVGLNFWREGGTISHNLRTVVLDADGKIFEQFNGNDWTAQQLAEAIAGAARKK
jgi:protein SCO1/2